MVGAHDGAAVHRREAQAQVRPQAGDPAAAQRTMISRAGNVLGVSQMADPAFYCDGLADPASYKATKETGNSVGMSQQRPMIPSSSSQPDQNPHRVVQASLKYSRSVGANGVVRTR